MEKNLRDRNKFRITNMIKADLQCIKISQRLEHFNLSTSYIYFYNVLQFST